MRPRTLHGIRKDMRELVAAAQAQGCAVALTGGNHIRVEAPGGLVFLALTPSSSGTAVSRAKLRRAGVSL